jgi:hypothetical protein
MRRQHFATANLVVFVETNRFKPSDPQYTGSKAVQLPVASADAGKPIRAAMTALAALYKRDYRYKKAGVILLDLVAAAARLRLGRRHISRRRRTARSARYLPVPLLAAGEVAQVRGGEFLCV